MTAGIYAHIATLAATPAGVGADDLVAFGSPSIANAARTLTRYTKRVQRLHMARRRLPGGRVERARYFWHGADAQAWLAADPWLGVRCERNGAVQLRAGKRGLVIPAHLVARLVSELARLPALHVRA